MKFFRAYFFSLFLHGLLLGLYFFRPRLPAIPNAPVVFVDLPAAAPMREGRAEAGAGKAERGQPNKGKATLPKGWSWRAEAARPGAGAAGTAAPAGRGERVFSFARSMGLAEEAKFHTWTEKIYRRLDAYIGYPPDFIAENINGRVTLHFLVDERGRFTGKFLEAEGEEDVLKIYTMAMVALALREPIFPDGPKREIPIAVNVHFRLLLPDEFTGVKNNMHFKNSLQFERVGHTDSKPTKAMRRFMDKYIPPIIPVPGGFYIDFVKLYRQVKEIDGNDEHWRRGIRMELDQQELELLLKKRVG